MADLLVTYRAERLRLNATAARATVAAWDRLIREPEEAITETLRLVSAAQARSAVMVDAYMTARRRQARVGRGTPGGIDPERYTVARLRRAPERDVYRRPFGALAGQLAQGAPFPAAAASGRASVARLALTDMQLAQTHAARDWMSADTSVYGYERVLGGGESCPLCVSAAQRIYYRDDLMPIHERCQCSVSPLWGEHPGGLSVPGKAARVVDDPEIGPRLMAEDWAA